LIVADIAIPKGLWDVGKTPEGVIANWFYRDGADIPAGAKVAEIMVEKTTYDVVAPTAGQLKIAVQKDGVVLPGTVIGRIQSG
jgi:pyruvate/2-oxoglutarate dehydrogenase complex dihydrolipoamide acyltransferase (E2) component